MRLYCVEKNYVIKFSDSRLALVLENTGSLVTVAYFDDNGYISTEEFSAWPFGEGKLEVELLGRGNLKVDWAKRPNLSRASSDFSSRIRYAHEDHPLSQPQKIECRFPLSVYIPIHLFADELHSVDDSDFPIDKDFEVTCADCYWKVGTYEKPSVFHVSVRFKQDNDLLGVGFYYSAHNNFMFYLQAVVEKPEGGLTRDFFEKTLSQLSAFPIDKIYSGDKLPVSWIPLADIEKEVEHE